MSKKNDRIKRLREEVAQLKRDLNEVLDNPCGDRAMQLRMMRKMKQQVADVVWSGDYPTFCLSDVIIKR